MQKIFSFFKKNKVNQKIAGAMISTTVKEAYGEGLDEEMTELIARYQKHLKKIDQYSDKIEEVEDFPKNHEWLNTKGGHPLSFDKELKNKIVVVDFWSSCCINCIHVLAEMDYLEKRFKNSKEIVFIGCHSAKFLITKRTFTCYSKPYSDMTLSIQYLMIRSSSFGNLKVSTAGLPFWWLVQIKSQF